jgi:putative membrane protein
MVADHSKANDELKALAQTKSISIPADVGPKHKATQDRLSKLSGAEFDRAYIQEMVTDHQKDVADFRKESQGGSDGAVKAFAAKTLPTLEEHYKMVQDINSSLRSNAVGTSGGRTGTGTGSGSGSGSGTGSGTPGTTPGSAGGSNPNGTSNPR